MSLDYQDVADFILVKFAEIKGKDTVTPMQLQKLVFYAQGIHLALYDEALFHQEIQAWKLGPVINPMYHRYKDYGNSAIESKELDSSKYDKEISVFLIAICNVFLSYTALQLSDMTHSETPWKSAYEERENREITIDAMKDFFKKSSYAKQVKDNMRNLVPFNFDLERMQQRLKGQSVEIPRFQTDDFAEWSKQFDKWMASRG